MCSSFLVVLLLCCCPNLLHSPCCAEPIAILRFIYLTHWCVEVNICIQEGHLGTLQFVIQGFGTKEQTFSISKPTSQVKKQCFAVIATYISSAEAIFVAESCSCCYGFNKLHFYFQVRRLYLTYINAVFDAFCLCVGQTSFIKRLRLCFGEVKSGKSGCEASVYEL